jgi:hypothetical protein
MIVLFATFLLLLVPIAVPRYWMVLLAAALSVPFICFVHWTALSAAADGYGTAQPGLVDLAVPALREGAIYAAVASILYFIKRLFVRAKPRTLSNID